MSVRYKPVGWTRSKLIYDIILLTGIVLFMVSYQYGVENLRPAMTALDAQSLEIRAWGACAFLLVTLVLMIGPLARLDTRFLPLLYNRRHFGVITCAVAGMHLKSVLDWYFAFSPLDPFVAMLAVDTGFGHLHGFPFMPFGIAAFMIMLVLAATSHDFWLSFLTPPLWKRIHMSIYVAYASIVLHVAFGAGQDARNLGLPLMVVGSAALLCALHLAAAWREQKLAAALSQPGQQNTHGWFDAGSPDLVPHNRGRVLTLPDGARVALFREGGALFAISNVCAHQNGPLGEGAIVDGKVICPWHGYEYRLRDGCAPAPYTERVRTYRLRIENNCVLIDPVPRPLGEAGEPARLTEASHAI
jgi:nitrite reductase/ring-hydroxylating ferredoxin subunit/DMSO/TMAO reductase YedYZ heme-binding membrane subunit